MHIWEFIWSNECPSVFFLPVCATGVGVEVGKWSRQVCQIWRSSPSRWRMRTSAWLLQCSWWVLATEICLSPLWTSLWLARSCCPMQMKTKTGMGEWSRCCVARSLWYLISFVCSFFKKTRSASVEMREWVTCGRTGLDSFLSEQLGLIEGWYCGFSRWLFRQYYPSSYEHWFVRNSKDLTAKNNKTNRNTPPNITFFLTFRGYRSSALNLSCLVFACVKKTKKQLGTDWRLIYFSCTCILRFCLLQLPFDINFQVRFIVARHSRPSAAACCAPHRKMTAVTPNATPGSQMHFLVYIPVAGQAQKIYFPPFVTCWSTFFSLSSNMSHHTARMHFSRHTRPLAWLLHRAFARAQTKLL